MTVMATTLLLRPSPRPCRHLFHPILCSRRSLPLPSLQAAHPADFLPLLPSPSPTIPSSSSSHVSVTSVDVDSSSDECDSDDSSSAPYIVDVAALSASLARSMSDKGVRRSEPLHATLAGNDADAAVTTANGAHSQPATPLAQQPTMDGDADSEWEDEQHEAVEHEAATELAIDAHTRPALSASLRLVGTDRSFSLRPTTADYSASPQHRPLPLHSRPWGWRGCVASAPSAVPACCTTTTVHASRRGTRRRHHLSHRCTATPVQPQPEGQCHGLLPHPSAPTPLTLVPP